MGSKMVTARTSAVQIGRESPCFYDCFDELLDAEYAPDSCRAIHLGCGDGRTAVHLARKGYQVMGIEPDRDLLAAARERATMSDVPMDLMGGEPLELPPRAEESFGIAVDLWTAAELADGLPRTDFLSSLHRLLRKDGILMSSTAAPKPSKGAKPSQGKATYAFSNAFVSDFTRAGFEVLFEGVRKSPSGEMRLVVHARRIG